MREKKARDRLIRLAQHHPEWVLGYQDETWWSRVSQPNLQTWSNDSWRLQELALDKSDRTPKALSCYGLLRADTGGMLLRLVAGRPVSQVTEDYLARTTASRGLPSRVRGVEHRLRYARTAIPTIFTNFGQPWTGMFNHTPRFTHVCSQCHKSFRDDSVTDVSEWIVANLDAEVRPGFDMVWDRRVTRETA